jgi:hypothetical protein
LFACIRRRLARPWIPLRKEGGGAKLPELATRSGMPVYAWTIEVLAYKMGNCSNSMELWFTKNESGGMHFNDYPASPRLTAVNQV